MVISKLLIRNMASSEGKEGFSIDHLQERAFPYPLYLCNQSCPEKLTRYLESNLATSSAMSTGFLVRRRILKCIMITPYYLLSCCSSTYSLYPGFIARGRDYLVDPDRNRLDLRFS